MMPVMQQTVSFRPQDVPFHGCMPCTRGDQTHLEVFHRTDLFGHLRSLCIRYRCEPSLSQPLEGQRVVPQIQLGPDEDHRYARGMVRDLWVPLEDRKGGLQ